MSPGEKLGISSVGETLDMRGRQIEFPAKVGLRSQLLPCRIEPAAFGVEVSVVGHSMLARCYVENSAICAMLAVCHWFGM